MTRENPLPLGSMDLDDYLDMPGAAEQLAEDLRLNTPDGRIPAAGQEWELGCMGRNRIVAIDGQKITLASAGDDTCQRTITLDELDEYGTRVK